MIAPHSGSGIGTPRPMNDRPLPARSAPPNRVADRMITGATTFGRMCRSMTRLARAPIARAASTYSRWPAERTEPRTRCAADGGWRRSLTWSAIGSAGAMSGANAAMRSSAPNRTSPTTSGGERRTRRRSGVTRRRGAAAARAALAIADPRVEPGVKDVDHEVRQQVRDRDEEDCPLHQREVAVEDRLDREAPHAGPAEDGLDDERAAEQGAELESDDRRHRDERVLERVPEDDEPLAQSLRARRPQVLLPEDLEHARARDARFHRGRMQAQRDDRQDVALPGARARHRQPVEREGEHDDADDREEERRHREPDDRDAHGDVIAGASAVDRRKDAETYADDGRERDRAERQSERVGKTLSDLEEHLAVRASRFAQAAVREALEEAEVLHRKRLVEPELVADALDLVGRRGVSREHRRGIAGDELDHEEDRDRYAEQDR